MFNRLGPLDPDVASEDWPILVVSVVDPGPQRSRLFQLYREVLRASPADAKALLSAPRVEVARGSRMEVEESIHWFQAAEATLDVVLDEPLSDRPTSPCPRPPTR